MIEGLLSEQDAKRYQEIFSFSTGGKISTMKVMRLIKERDEAVQKAMTKSATDEEIIIMQAREIVRLKAVLVTVQRDLEGFKRISGQGIEAIESILSASPTATPRERYDERRSPPRTE